MMRSILVGLDGTDDCRVAVDLGICWARRFDCLLVGIGVVDEPTIRGHQPGGQISPSYQAAYDQLLTATRHDVEQALERFAIRCSHAEVAFKLLEDEGQPCERILTELQRYDLLILGCKTHFRPASGQRACETLENVLRSASRPVIVAPKVNIDKHRGGVVVAYDGSVQAARALQAFLGSGLTELGMIRVVTVHPESSIEAARIADRAAEFLRFHDIETQRVSLVGSPAAQQFVAYAEEKSAELLVMGAYGQSRMKEFFFGSATCTALEASTVPLFLFH